MNTAISKIPNANLISECHNRLNKIGKMTLNKVSEVDDKTRQFLCDSTPKRLNELAQMNCYAATKIKSELDIKFGENNYVFIAIGRSLSSIAELMEHLGVNVKIIPLSELRKIDLIDIPQKDLMIYKKFLAEIGISKTELNKNKDKTYILADYTHYGRSLEKAEKMLKMDKMLGNAENLITMPAQKLLGEDYYSRGFETLFSCSKFRDYSYVGKLPADNLKDVCNQCSPDRIAEFKGNITQGLRKLFWFNVFDSLKKQNYANILPFKELDAIYKNYMSPTAIENRSRNMCRKQEKLLNSLPNKV